MTYRRFTLACALAALAASQSLPSAAADVGRYASAGASQTAYTQGQACVVEVHASTLPDATSSTGAAAGLAATGNVVCTRSIDRLEQQFTLLVNGVAVRNTASVVHVNTAAANVSTDFTYRAVNRQVRYCVNVVTTMPNLSKLVCATTALGI